MSLEAIRHAVRAQARGTKSAANATTNPVAERDLTTFERAALRTAARRARRSISSDGVILPPNGAWMWI